MVTGIGILVSIGMCMIAGFVQASSPYADVSAIYSLFGFTMFVFGVWGAIVLISEAKK